MTGSCSPIGLRKWGAWLLLLFAWSLPTSLFGMQLFAVAGFFFVLTCALVSRGTSLSTTPLDKPVVWLLAAIGLSLLLAPRPPTSFRTATSFWVLVAFYASYFLLDSRTTLRRAVFGFVALACGVALFGVYQSLSGRFPLGELIHPDIMQMQPLLKPATGRSGLFGAVGLFHSRLTLAHVLLFPLCWALGLALERVGLRLRLLCVAAVSVLVGGLVFTWTRAAPLAAGLAAVMLVVGSLRRGWPRRLGWLALAVAAGLVFVVLPSLPKHLTRSFSGMRDWGRLAIWQTALDLAAEEPLTGIGYGNFQRDAAPLVEQRQKEVGAKRFPGTLAWAHNNLLSFAAEAGALGALAFCWLFLAYFRSVKRQLGKLAGDPLVRGFVRGSAAAVAAFLVVGLFHDPFFDGEVIFSVYFTMGASLAAGRLVQSAEGEAG